MVRRLPKRSSKKTAKKSLVQEAHTFVPFSTRRTYMKYVPLHQEIVSGLIYSERQFAMAEETSIYNWFLLNTDAKF